MNQRDKQNILIAFVTLNAYGFLAVSGVLYQLSESIANILSWEVKVVFIITAVSSSVVAFALCVPALLCVLKFIFPKRR